MDLCIYLIKAFMYSKLTLKLTKSLAMIPGVPNLKSLSQWGSTTSQPEHSRATSDTHQANTAFNTYSHNKSIYLCTTVIFFMFAEEMLNYIMRLLHGFT